MTSLPHVRHGFGCVRPYLYGPVDLPEFVAQVFGAREIERHAFGPDNFHIELQLGDSVVVVEAGELPAGQERGTSSVVVYVDDADAVYAKAIAHGAAAIAPPVDKPYRERQCGFIDAAGNTWWVSTYLEGRASAA